MKRSRASKPDRDAPLSLADDRVWQALRKPFRWRLFEAVRASGGITAQALAVRVGLTPQLMLYHLRLLQAASLIDHGQGRRARGQGGVFTAARGSIGLRDATRDAKSSRRLRKLVRAFEDDALAHEEPAAPSPRWERLRADEVREIEALFGRIEAVLDSARSRREGDASLPDATHVIALGVRAIRSGSLPTTGWRRGRGR